MNPEESVLYFEKAVSSKPTNFPAWIDLFQTEMGSLFGNENKVAKHFDDVMKYMFWSREELYTFRFLYGCYLWLVGDKDAAVDQWIQYAPQNQNFRLVTDFMVRVLCPIKQVVTY